MDYPRLKIRKGKENSQTRQLKTEYQPKDGQVSFKDHVSPTFDSIGLTRYTDRPKGIEIKFIPMRGIDISKKLITEPKNIKRMNQSERQCAQKIFKQEPIRKYPNKISESVTQTKLIGKQRYMIQSEIGSGTFGTVYKARDKKTLEQVAIKKVFQDKNYKNRELEILKIIKHPNILRMQDCFFTVQGQKQYLNVVMDHFSSNLYEFIANNLGKSQIPTLLAKIIAYQLFRGLLYLETEGIAHRDIKPQNILINQRNWKLVICDFGSAKKLKKGQPNISYICSRSYRAPELIFGCTDYTPQIDMWSAACSLIQILKIQPLFKARSSSEHLIEIIKVFGTPTPEEIRHMNPKFDITQLKLPIVQKKQFAKVLGKNHLGDQFADLMSKILKYSPFERFTPFQALKHQFFDELRDEAVYRKLRAQYSSLQLFNFRSTKESTISKIGQLIPKWYK